MILKIVSLSRTRSAEIKQLEAEYLKRTSRVEVIEPKKTFNSQSQETEWLNQNLKGINFIVSLDENGRQFTTEAFANVLKKQMNQGHSAFAFIIGSAYGLAPEVKKQSDLLWALSELTFPFQIARLLVVEQLYRVICHISGHPYHKQ